MTVKFDVNSGKKKIDFSVNNRVTNDIPRIINGELFFGHWSHRHQTVVGKEPAGERVWLARRLNNDYISFPEVFGEPELRVIRYEGIQFSGIKYVYTGAIVLVNDGHFESEIEYAVKLSEFQRVDVPLGKLSEEQKLRMEAAKLALKKRVEKEREEYLLKKSEKVLPEIKLNRQRVKWLTRFVQSDGRKSYQQVEELLHSEGWDYSDITVSNIKKVFGVEN